MFTILSCDGGGVFGALTAALIEKMDKSCPQFLASVDLFTGTSTGSFIALGLAAGYTPTEIVTFYQQYGPKVFPKNLFRTVLSGDGALFSRYPNTGLKAALKTLFGDKKMSDLKRKVLIPTFQLDGRQKGDVRSWTTVFFDETSNDLIVDVALRSSAAPCLFPSHQGFIDGGVTCNNPAVAAVSEAFAKGKQLSDIKLLSIGTGKGKDYIPGDVSWGALGWGIDVLKILLLAGMEVQDHHCRMLLGKSYFRLNPVVGNQIGMDDVGEIPALIKLGRATDTTAVGRFCWAGLSPVPLKAEPQ